MVVELLGKEFNLVAPAGSFYAFPSFPAGADPKDFVARAIQRKLLIVPGSAFSSRGTHFRLSFAASDQKLRQGLELLNELARG